VLNYQTLNAVSQRQECDLPQSLEAFGLDYHWVKIEKMPALNYSDELLIKDILRTRAKELPNLKSILVLNGSTGEDYEPVSTKTDHFWLNHRNSLEKLSMLNGGGVKLAELQPRQISEYFQLSD